MVSLPFLVVHGAAVWVGLVLAIALGVAAARRRRGWRRAVCEAGIGGALAIAVLWGAGRLATQRAQSAFASEARHEAARVAYDLGELDPLSIAAALPGSRSDALEELHRRLDWNYVRDRASLERWQQLARVRGGCGGELAMLREQDRLGELERIAGVCDDEAEVLDTLVFLGDYAGAARRIDHPTIRGVIAQIGTRAWKDVVRSLTVSRTRPLDLEDECTVLYFRFLAGEGDAARLHEAAGQDRSCRVIDALTQQLEQQGPALLDAYRDAPTEAERQNIEVLAWAAGAPLVPHDHVHDGGLDPSWLLALAPPDDRSTTRLAVLAPLAVAVRHDAEDSPAFALTRLWHAQYELLRGDLRAAAVDARAAARTASENTADIAKTAQEFQVMLALRTGAPVPEESHPDWDLASPILSDVVELARGKAPAWRTELSLMNHSCSSHPQYAVHDTMAAAVAGNGAPLSELIDRCGIRVGYGMDFVFGIWPRIHQGHERLRAQLAIAAAERFAANDPFSALRRALLRRDLARLIGDTAGAAAWQRVIDRHLAALADRQVVTALAVWQLGHLL